VQPVRRLLIAASIGASLLGAGCGSDGDGEPSAATAATSPALVGPDEFARRIEAPGVVTINVHTPDEGSIAGTDLTIAFDQITTSSELPDELSTPLAVYCRSDNMSADAVDDLKTLGYTDIVELDGGFNAWVEAGRALEPAATE
jgi:rhodanese-related sulfurtransferase